MSLDTLRTLEAGGRRYRYHSLTAAAERLGDLSRLPYALKILAENLLRHLDGRTVTVADVEAIAAWLGERRSQREIAFHPARVLMQDFTGVPAVADLAAMREAMAVLGGDPVRINPLTPVDLVIDHSVMVDRWASPEAFEANVAFEMERNRERYAFLRWGQQAFDNFRVVPPGTGICHQVNLEHLARVVWTRVDDDDAPLAFPDTLVGTDSHTTMINALGVLGWGVGGIEAEAAMLGQPVTMVVPEVIGVRLEGALPEGATATDLVLAVTERLRARGVVGRFVEFFGPGLEHLTLPDRATLANMAPEYGATCGIFPIDAETVRYLELTGRDPTLVALVEAYARAQGLWRDPAAPEPAYTDVVEVDLGAVEPCIAGPRRPQDRIPLHAAAASFRTHLPTLLGRDTPADAVPAREGDLRHGDIVIAAITSCTNTSNPSVMLAAGMLARNAVERGLEVKPWVKTSLAPGSQVVIDYLKAAGLMRPLEALGFHVVGFGCTTCIGNSGPLPEEVARAIEEHDVVACAVLSGNRNFEGRIHPLVRANYLASPPLVVAYAIAGNMGVDLAREPLGKDRHGEPVYLRDLWPSAAEIAEAVRRHLDPKAFRRRYADVDRGPAAWCAVDAPTGPVYTWDERSTYIRRPPFFDGITPEPPPLEDIIGARPLAILGDSVTTDHISPAGTIQPDSPAGRYLIARGVQPRDFNSFGSRRGNHEVMVRGTFGNIRLRNEMAPGTSGGITRHMPDGEEMPIHDAAMAYAAEGVPLVVIAGREYGTGSSRDWAAKGTRLLGVRAVIAESFERIHRSNLVGMGVLPLEFPEGVDRRTLGLDGSETFDIRGIADGLAPGARLEVTVHPRRGRPRTFEARCRIDTEDELAYYRHDGILAYVLRRLAGT